MKLNLERLSKELDRLLLLNDSESMMKGYDLCTQFECKSFHEYGKVLDIVKESGGTKVYDIGCATGYQSEVFMQAGMDYVGIEGYFTNTEFWNEDIFKYIRKAYPFKIDTKNTDVAISKLCIGWGCFCFEEDTYSKQLKALARDFNTVILYTTEEFINLAKDYFNVEKKDNNLYLLKNKKNMFSKEDDRL